MNIPTELSAQTSAELRDEFMTLLVAQLRNQDPLEPVKQENFISQLAQFSTLESIEGLGGRFEEMLQVQELSYGANLVGKTVVYDTVEGQQSGVVQSVFSDSGSVIVDVDGTLVDLNHLVGVGQAPPTEESV